MDIQGEQTLPLPRQDVWRALNDPATLQRCLAGCDTFEAIGPDTYRVALQASVGPVRARFMGRLVLQDMVPPESYALAFEGSGGVAGFGKGTARVVLSDAPGGTLLCYTAQAQVGGRLAQVGSRLITGVTRKMADDFFARFALALQPSGQGTHSNSPAVPEAVAAPTPQPPTAPGHPAQPNPQRSKDIAVLAAAIAATAASVAVLAALVVLRHVG